MLALVLKPAAFVTCVSILRSTRAIAAAGPAISIDNLIETVRSGRSYKLRVHAAVLLASTGDPRAVATLAYAAGRDPGFTTGIPCWHKGQKSGG